jgi:phospholipid transport system substrate-binding protein
MIMTFTRPRSGFLSLSGWLGLLTLAVLAMPFSSSVARAEQPAQYMQRVANELVAAARQGTSDAFMEVMQRHADLPSIGLYSLGSYAKSLPSSERDSYYTGMLTFISRYAASQAPQYPVLKAVVIGQTEETRAGVYVDSVVTLRDGTNYDVRWWLIRRGKSFKVGDAEVMGFWAREQLKRLFETYISENGGNPKTLVLALNR